MKNKVHTVRQRAFMNFGTGPGHSEIHVCYVRGSCRLDPIFCILHF